MLDMNMLLSTHHFSTCMCTRWGRWCWKRWMWWRRGPSPRRASPATSPSCPSFSCWCSAEQAVQLSPFGGVEFVDHHHSRFSLFHFHQLYSKLDDQITRSEAWLLWTITMWLIWSSHSDKILRDQPINQFLIIIPNLIFFSAHLHYLVR